MSTNFALLGATGLVGANILQYLLQSPTPSRIATLTRRELEKTSSTHTLVSAVEKDTEKWPALFADACKSSSPPPIAITALGTTRGAAGSFEKQYAIDHDLNLAIAKAAKEAGVTTFVLISSAGANKNSSFAYPKMKGELEENIEAIGFDKYVIVRPGMLLGDRTESRPMETVFRSFATGLQKISGGALSDSWAQNADCVARAAVRAALDESITGKKILDQKQVLHYGKADGW